MNPGYLSLVLFCIALILMASGWSKVLFVGLSNRLLFGLAVTWLALTFMNLQLGRWQVDLAFGFYCFITLAGLVVVGKERLPLLAMGVLLGGSWFLFGELIRLNPALSIPRPVLAGPLLLVAAAILLHRPCLPQIILLNTALLSGHLMSAASSKSAPIIAGPAFQDAWWLTILVARPATILLESMFASSRRLLVLIRQRKKNDGN